MTEKKPYLHEKTLAVAWGDMDALGHVNNARYLDYFQEARIDWLASINIQMREETGPILVHVACTFLKPVVYPATINIKSRAGDVGNSSFVIEHDLFQGEQLMAQGLSKIVWVDYNKIRPVPVPEFLKQALKAG